MTASVTYARGEDTDPDAYEYQAQWSLRGGQGVSGKPGVAARQLGRRHAVAARPVHALSKSRATSKR